MQWRWNQVWTHLKITWTKFPKSQTQKLSPSKNHHRRNPHGAQCDTKTIATRTKIFARRIFPAMSYPIKSKTRTQATLRPQKWEPVKKTNPTLQRLCPILFGTTTAPAAPTRLGQNWGLASWKVFSKRTVPWLYQRRPLFQRSKLSRLTSKSLIRSQGRKPNYSKPIYGTWSQPILTVKTI